MSNETYKIIDEDGTYIDNVGGQHSCGVGWNPNGLWCGECSTSTCEGCAYEFATEDLKQVTLKSAVLTRGSDRREITYHLTALVVMCSTMFALSHLLVWYLYFMTCIALISAYQLLSKYLIKNGWFR